MDRRQFITTSLSTLTGAALLGPAALHAIAGAAPATQGKTMRRRAIPATGEKLPVVGLGTWQTFDPEPINEQTLKPLRDVLEQLQKLGGTVVDSSPMYGDSERVVGRLASELEINDALFFATKVWTRGKAQGIAQMKQSLKRLQRDKLELMQVHNLVDWQTHLPVLKQWQQQGKLKYVGITHYQVSAFDELERVMRGPGVDFVQLPYSVVTRAAEKNLLPAAKATDTAVLVNRPFEGGRLFRQINNEPLPEAFQGFARTWAQGFLKFILAHPAVTAVIPGTSDPKHMRDNALAGYGRLPDEKEREALAAHFVD